MTAELLLLIAVLCPQAPLLERSTSQEIPERRHTGLSVSTAGKYLVLQAPDLLDIRDAETLKPVKEISVKSIAIGFDAEDGRLLVVGESVLRYDTKTWTPQVLGELPDARFKSATSGADAGRLQLRLAFVTSELDIHYCSESGVSTAVFDNGKLRTKKMGLNCPEWVGPISGLLDFTDSAVLLTLDGGRPGIAVEGRVNSLLACDHPILGTTYRGLGVCVGRNAEALYSAQSWKILQRRGQREDGEIANLCAAIDRTSGWVFVGDREGLRAWPVEKFATVVRYHQILTPVSQIAVPTSSRVLFTLEKNVLRRWKIGDP